MGNFQQTEMEHSLAQHFIYRTRAIITRGLYTFYPLFKAQKRFFKGLFFLNSGLMYGKYLRAVSNQERVTMARVRYIKQR